MPRSNVEPGPATASPIVLGLVALLAGIGLIVLGLASRQAPDDPSPIDPTLVVDVNTAPAGVLLALPKLGPAIVGSIVAERERRPFTSLDDLDRRVPRVGPATVEALRPHLRFGPGTDEPTPAP